MELTILNQSMTVRVDTLGAQLMSLQTANGQEQLWQGDAKYWAKRAPVLFPYVGRLTENSYRYRGKLYRMGIHGFAAASEFTVVTHEPTKLVLLLESDSARMAQYPFFFQFFITYQLEGNSLHTIFEVRNRDEKVMVFGLGGHPGFRVPADASECFEDYRLEFTDACQPDRVGFSPQVYLNGQDHVYPLEQDRILRLRHDLFDDDAIVLKNMGREVTLCSDSSKRAITVTYPDMPYLGIWHWPHTDAPYVCIEPWASLPSRQDVVEELSCQSDLIHLKPGDAYKNRWTITVRTE